MKSVLLPCFAALWLLLGSWSGGAFAALSCAGPGCHGALLDQPVLHAPVADQKCGTCHEYGGAPHPGPSRGFTLKAEGKLLCESCHGDIAADKAHVHPPVADGECLACHDPHGGPHPALLVADSASLCQECHGEIGSHGRVHGPVRAGRCDYCHLPHASAEPALLSLPGNKVCFACHSGIRTTIETSRSQHQPVAEGRCWDCHRTHDAEFRPLLQGYYPREFYAPFAAENFALCFQQQCHPNLGTFDYQRTSEATGFRNGDQNLHYLHVNKPVKGRVCRNCHGIHGADQEKLIPSRVPGFGQWKIPVRFLPTETGATCLAGCHKPKSYDRVRPVKNP